MNVEALHATALFVFVFGSVIYSRNKILSAVKFVLEVMSMLIGVTETW